MASVSNLFNLATLDSQFVRIIVLIGCMCTLATNAKSQQTEVVGKKLRITATSVFQKHVVGWAVILTSDTLSLRGNDTRLIRIATSNIDRCEMSIGKRSHPGTGALVGGTAGMISALFLLKIASDRHPENEGLYRLAIGAGFGSLFGIFIGSTIKSDQWIELSLDSLQISASPSTNGTLGLSVSLPF